ncbi:phosphoesterase [Leptospira perolatii]|uniref:phosphoesterase n=1 Tax=Leptospira perolatii TaxID=2023191 RepID=UPI001FAF4AF1|nr:phosphoesterase [Leptospira perolatii]
MWLKRLIYFTGGLFALLVSFNIWTLIFLRSDLASNQSDGSIQKNRIYNPYESSTKLKWVKAALHIHTDAAWFTPGRNTPEEIQKVYSKFGYKLIGFTDYETVTKSKEKVIAQLPGYEWGRNFRKRHLMILGTETPDHDFFPLYANPENVQWEIDRQQKLGNFITINHPQLNESFPLEIVQKLSGYDAIEVFSPFGDIPAFWDRLLSAGLPSFCMASDDLHYLPKEEFRKIQRAGLPSFQQLTSLLYGQEGESLTRFILLNTDSLETEDVVRALKSGNYACVRKMERSLEDPVLGSFGIKDKKIVYFSFGDLAMQVDFIGANGVILQRLSGVREGNYEFRNDDTFVRIQAYFPTAVVLSNPFYPK